MRLFLNQMLYSSLTSGDVLTEAHHVSSAGVDGGVVYSEMKGINQKTSWRLRERVKELLYAGGNSSYAYNRGGTAEGLQGITRERVSTDSGGKHFVSPQKKYFSILYISSTIYFLLSLFA